MEPTACFLVEDNDGTWAGPNEPNIGAMYWRSHDQPVGPTDTNPRPLPHLAVMTPGGLACLDCPAKQPPAGRYWIWVGEPPNITVTPSLDVRDERRPWHGFITAGIMRDA